MLPCGIIMNNRNNKHKTQRRLTRTQDKSYFHSLREMVGEERGSEKVFAA